jgi:hypothetical protein
MMMMTVRLTVIVGMTVPVIVGIGVGVRVGVRMHGGLVLAAYTELRSRDSGARHAFDPHVVWGNRQAAQCAAHVVERHAGIDQRTKQHVT